MIDLTRSKLPSELVVDGRGYPILTGFRIWMQWGRLYRNGFASAEIFAGDVPPGEWTGAALEFYRSENPFPRGSGGGRVTDDFYDGDYIVAAFMQLYGIDLTSCDLHWHLYLALLRGIPTEGTRYAEIIGYRSWSRSKRKPEQVYADAKRAWSLPEPETVRYEDQPDPLAGMYTDPDELKVG